MKVKYNFIWTAPSGGAPIISIASYGITFNSFVIEIMKRPEKIMMGFDEEKKVVGFKPIYNKKDDNPKCFPFRERKGYVRIGNRDFIKYISNKTGIDFTNSIRYIADWNEEEQLAVINLMKPMDGSVEIDEESIEKEEE